MPRAVRRHNSHFPVEQWSFGILAFVVIMALAVYLHDPQMAVRPRAERDIALKVLEVHTVAFDTAPQSETKAQSDEVELQAGY